jgi:Chaperone of endosialidase
MPWQLNGNSGTNPATDYIGTSDLQPLVVKTNAVEALRIAQRTGNVGIGTAAPESKLHVVGPGGGAVVAKFEQPPGAMNFIELKSTTGGQNFGSDIIFRDSGVLNAEIKSTADNQLRFATAGKDRLTIASDGTVQVEVDVVLRSDARLKANIQPVMDAARAIERIRGVKFRRMSADEDSQGFSGINSIGVLAQDVEPVFPELIRCDNNNYKAVNYNGLVGVLIEAVKEIIAENRTLRLRIETIEASI